MEGPDPRLWAGSSPSPGRGQLRVRPISKRKIPGLPETCAAVTIHYRQEMIVFPPGADLGSAVEAEDELVEVGVEALLGDAALTSAEQPPLQQRGKAMHGGHDHVHWIIAGGDRADDVRVAEVGEALVGAEADRVDDRAGLPGLFDESSSVLRCVFSIKRMRARPKPCWTCPVGFSTSDRHDLLPRRTTSTTTRPRAADKPLVDLDLAGELRAAGPGNDGTQLVPFHPGPRSINLREH
jgi:hypothetical protein